MLFSKLIDVRNSENFIQRKISAELKKNLIVEWKLKIWNEFKKRIGQRPHVVQYGTVAVIPGATWHYKEYKSVTFLVYATYVISTVRDEGVVETVTSQ